MQSYQDRVVMVSTAEHQAEGKIVIIIIYGMNAIELLLAHNTCTYIDSISSNIYITYLTVFILYCMTNVSKHCNTVIS